MKPSTELLCKSLVKTTIPSMYYLPLFSHYTLARNYKTWSFNTNKQSKISNKKRNLFQVVSLENRLFSEKLLL